MLYRWDESELKNKKYKYMENKIVISIMKSILKRNRPMLKGKRLLTKRKILKRLVEKSIKYFLKRSYPRTGGKSSPSRIRPIQRGKLHASRVCEAGTGSSSIHWWGDITSE